MQLARERVLGGFARLDLAAGKFPPARIHLAGRALREQEAAVWPFDDRGGDFDHYFFSVCLPAPEPLLRRPAQSRANW